MPGGLSPSSSSEDLEKIKQRVGPQLMVPWTASRGRPAAATAARRAVPHRRAFLVHCHRLPSCSSQVQIAGFAVCAKCAHLLKTSCQCPPPNADPPRASAAAGPDAGWRWRGEDCVEKKKKKKKKTGCGSLQGGSTGTICAGLRAPRAIPSQVYDLRPHQGPGGAVPGQLAHAAQALGAVAPPGRLLPRPAAPHRGAAPRPPLHLFLPPSRHPELLREPKPGWPWHAPHRCCWGSNVAPHTLQAALTPPSPCLPPCPLAGLARLRVGCAGLRAPVPRRRLPPAHPAGQLFHAPASRVSPPARRVRRVGAYLPHPAPQGQVHLHRSGRRHRGEGRS